MLLALLGNSMQAQNKLYGTVENNGKPLPYVTVRLLETDSTFVSGVTTDTLGKYVFSNIEKGNYLEDRYIGEICLQQYRERKLFSSFQLNRL